MSIVTSVLSVLVIIADTCREDTAMSTPITATQMVDAVLLVMKRDTSKPMPSVTIRLPLHRLALSPTLTLVFSEIVNVAVPDSASST